MKSLKTIFAVVLLAAMLLLCACGKDAHTCADANGDGKCDNCGAAVQPTTPNNPDEPDEPTEPCDKCVDEDGDGECDVCGEPYVLSPESLDAFINAYANSIPTKVETEIKRVYGIGATDYSTVAYELNTKSVLLSGVCAGKVATVYKVVYDEFRSIDEGADQNIVGEIKTTTYEKVFLEGKGVRETTELDGVKTGGEWDTSALNFAPTAGSIAISLSEDNVKNLRFTIEDYNHVMRFVVPKAKIKAVFGNGIDATSDVSVTLVSNGATITSLSFSYTVEGSEKDAFPGQRVIISANYDYGMQNITIE